MPPPLTPGAVTRLPAHGEQTITRLPWARTPPPPVPPEVVGDHTPADRQIPDGEIAGVLVDRPVDVVRVDDVSVAR